MYNFLIKIIYNYIFLYFELTLIFTIFIIYNDIGNIIYNDIGNIIRNIIGCL